MFSHFDGVVSEKQAGSLVIDCGGVGYLLQVSNTTLSAAPAVGERMKVYALLSVREDAMELFGFATREERPVFAGSFHRAGRGGRHGAYARAWHRQKDRAALGAGTAR